MRLTILDTETSGLNDKAEILSLAYMHLDNKLKVNDAGVLYFYSPFYKSNPEAEAIHGLKQDFLINFRKDYEENIDKAFFLLNRQIVIGHNISFDARMINQTIGRHGLKATPYDLICTMYGTKHLNGGKYFKLANLLKYLYIDEDTINKKTEEIFGKSLEAKEGFHSAAYDVTATYLACCVLCSDIPELMRYLV